MKRLSLVLWCFIFAYLGLVLYTNRALFFSRFDAVYWKDKYEHSQWKLPLSVRTLGDDGLYLYEGYRLIHGEDPTVLNAEVPPLGKYLIGLMLISFGNGYWYGFIATVAAVSAFYFLARLFINRPILALAATATFLFDPLLTHQFTLTMLDSLQLLFSLLTFLVLAKTISKSSRAKPLWITLLGVMFGLFAATKAPIFSPFLGLVILGSLWWQYRQLKPLIIFLAAAFVTYLAPYLPYFSLGHSFRDWLGVQKWILQFYRHSYLQPNLGSTLTTLLFNRYQNLFSHAWENSSQWSLSWPITTVLTVIWSWQILRSKTKDRRRNVWIPLMGFLTLMILFLSIIPFWSRYLLPIVPLLYIGAFAFLAQNYKKLVWILPAALLGINFLASTTIFFPTPETTVKQFTHDWQYGFFQDMYENLTTGARQAMDRQAFHRFGLTAYAHAAIEASAVDVLSAGWSPWRSPQEIKLRVTYFTRDLGPFSEEKTLSLVKEDGRWRIPWQWSDLISGLSPLAKLETTVFSSRRGTILASDKKHLAEDVPSFLVWITPMAVDKTQEEAMLKFLEGVFEGRVAAISLHQRSVGNTLADMTIPLGVIPYRADEKLRQKILTFPGLSLTPKSARISRLSTIVDVGTVGNTNYFECCSLLYSTTTYDGLRGVEKENNALLKGYNGGSLVIKDAQGKIVRTIIKLGKKDGTDVQL